MDKKRNRTGEKISTVDSDIPLDARRGTGIWGLNQLRHDGLVQFMSDLLELEEKGLDPAQCEIVRKSLENISIQSSAIPDDFLIRSSIMDAFDKFKEAYLEWNKIDGIDEKAMKNRRRALDRMKKRRQKLASVVRKNQFILSEALDLKLIEDMYQALGAIPNALPDLFTNLRKAISRFEKKDPNISVASK